MHISMHINMHKVVSKTEETKVFTFKVHTFINPMVSLNPLVIK